ncbi:MAG TPA: dTDP-4-dehydrorhamnose reductase [Terracidiphilus sp.]|jgi:dTDP-4-dehydrorhamnose reductase
MSEKQAATQVHRPRILILGSAGQLGLELQRSFADLGEITAADRSSVNLAQPDEIRVLVREIQPDIILNAAAYTAVDRAESEPELAYSINAEAPGILALEARRLDALLIHYSTDYVFDGTKPGPWTEDDPTHPLNVYGASKLAGEAAIHSSGARALVFRTSWVYGAHGKNFLFTMLRLARERERLSVVDDQIGAPTTSRALARATREIVSGLLAGRFGSAPTSPDLFHMTCSGSTSWLGFAQAIFARAALLDVKAPELVPIATAGYPTPAARPRNSVLSNAKLQERFAVQLPAWETALDEVVQILQGPVGGDIRRASSRAKASE